MNILIIITWKTKALNRRLKRSMKIFRWLNHDLPWFYINRTLISKSQIIKMDHTPVHINLNRRSIQIFHINIRIWRRLTGKFEFFLNIKTKGILNNIAIRATDTSDVDILETEISRHIEFYPTFRRFPIWIKIKRVLSQLFLFLNRKTVVKTWDQIIGYRFDNSVLI